MKKLIIIAVALTFLLPMISSTTIAQDAPESQIYWVVAVNAKLAKSQDYESAIKDFVGLLKQSKFGTPISVAVLEDFRYQFASAYPNFAAIDKANAELIAMMQTENGQVILKRLLEATNSSETIFAMSRPDLAYVPENPRLKPEERVFRYREYLYVEASKEAEIEEAFKKYNALLKKHKVSNGTWVGTGFSGTNLPYYMSVSSGKSASDFWIEREKAIAAMGLEYQELVAEVTSILRGYETIDVVPRPDLSYVPE